MKPSTGQATALGLILAVAAAFLAYRFVLDLELMGWDSYPIIAASRVEDPGDLLGSLTEELMGGRYPGGRFYRPITNLSFALDHASSGLDPAGYQRTNLLLHLAGVVAVFALGRRWLGPGPGCVLAALVFAVHPLQLETVPVAARRADMLFTLFLVLALSVQPVAGGASWRRLATGALLVVLSAASKDTGAVALPVVAAALWILPTRGDPSGRTRRTARLAALPAAAFLVFLALRTLVLGGVGGHPGSSLIGGAVLGLLAAPDYAHSLLAPQPWTGAPLLDTGLWIVLAGGLGWGVSLAAQSGDAAPEPDGPEADARKPRPQRPPPGRLATFLAFWLACLLAMTGISGERAPWYAVPFLPAYALLLGLVLDCAARRWRAGPHAAAPLAAGCQVLVVAGSHIRYSPLFHSYDEWEVLSGQARSFLDRFHTVVSTAETGTTVSVAALPLGAGAPLERVGVRSALCLSDYSVAAWAELALPERPVHVRLQTGGPPTPATPGAVNVDVVPLPSPALRRAPDAAR